MASSFIQSSTRFDSLDTQTHQILDAILSIKNELPRHEIIDVMSRLLCRSEDLNQDEHYKTRQMITDLRNTLAPASSGVDNITTQIEMLSVHQEEEKSFRNGLQRKILELLSYPYMTDRYEQVLEAHPQTFNWIFCESDQWDFPWDNFGQWLRQGQGIYWINGKPASGKSTLMKHIHDDNRTKEYLRLWNLKTTSESVPCCIATFFFWDSGTNMQKSQNGLLRALLFQVLGRHPELIPLVLPARWAKIYSGTLTVGQEILPDAWATRELHDALERLVCQTQYPLSIFFCIDGLDEFSGDPEQLCLFFKRLSTKSDSIKICLSSRPWVTFK